MIEYVHVWIKVKAHIDDRKIKWFF